MEEDEDKDEEVISSLSLCYKRFITPVYDLLEEPEINIGPDRSLYKVPFAALSEKEGAEYLSETHRIRVIPSLTTLKMIQNSLEDYHSSTGALIMGNPKVGRCLHWSEMMWGSSLTSRGKTRWEQIFNTDCRRRSFVTLNIKAVLIYIYMYIFFGELLETISGVKYRIAKVPLCQSDASVGHLYFYMLYIQNNYWVNNKLLFLIFSQRETPTK